MKKILLVTITVFLSFSVSASVFGQAQAAFLNFDKDTFVVSPGNTFDVQVVVDAGSDQISSIDSYVIYDPSLLEAQGVVPRDYFPTVINNITSGRLYVAGLVDDPATFKTGSGTVAAITFKALVDGSGSLTYDCQPGVYNSSKIIKNDLNATNIIDCDQNGKSSVTVGAGVSNGSSNTATPSALPRAGVFENFSKVALSGMILLMLGGALRIIL